jgi:rubrerythrin
MSSPFTADEGLFDRDAEQDQIDFYEDQRNRCASDWVPAQSQQTNVQNREDDHLGEGQHADAEEVKQEDPGQEQGEVRQSVGFILRLK